jgi:hypothetical protein
VKPDRLEFTVPKAGLIVSFAKLSLFDSRSPHLTNREIGSQDLTGRGGSGGQVAIRPLKVIAVGFI